MGYEPMLQGLCHTFKELSAAVVENALNPIDPIPIDETHRLVPFELHYGDSFPDARMSFRLVGNAEGPVVAVLGGISAHRVVVGQGEGWWPEMVKSVP